MHVTLVHIRVKPDAVAAMMAEPRRGEPLLGLLPA